MICKLDQQFPENALFSCTQTIEVACIVLVSNLSKCGHPSKILEEEMEELMACSACVTIHLCHERLLISKPYEELRSRLYSRTISFSIRWF